MGETPPAFDLLYWNGDGANLPGKMAVQYLRGLCQHNQFAEGEFELMGETLQLKDVTVPLMSRRLRDGPHRRLEGLSIAACRRWAPGQDLRHVGIGPYRGHREPAEQEEVRPLHQRRSRARRRRVAGEGGRVQRGLLVAALGGWLAKRSGKMGRRPATPGDCGRIPPLAPAPGKLCEGQPGQTSLHLINSVRRNFCCSAAITLEMLRCSMHIQLQLRDTAGPRSGPPASEEGSTTMATKTQDFTAMMQGHDGRIPRRHYRNGRRVQDHGDPEREAVGRRAGSGRQVDRNLDQVDQGHAGQARRHVQGQGTSPPITPRR